MTATQGGHDRRPVITGWGAVTPLGLTADQTWAGLISGKSGIGTVTCVESDDLPTNLAGEVKDFDPYRYMNPRQARRTDPYAQYALAAAAEAMSMAGAQVLDEEADRVGVLIGSGYGPMSSIGRQVTVLNEHGPRRVSPFAQITGAIDSAACEIGCEYGAMGPSRALSSACASGADAIGEAARWIRLGIVDMAIVGGAEHILTRLDLASSGNAHALAPRTTAPAEASRPFDEDRTGFVMSAGAGIVVLESARHAAARGATPLAEVAGYAATSDAHHWTAPHPEGRGIRSAMLSALGDAGLCAEDVDYVNAHGTSTRLNDQAELDALRTVFKNRIERIPVSSTKSMTGHMIGAAGAVEAIISGLAIQHGVVPPTINCHKPIDTTVNFVPHQAQKHQIDVVMSNAFGFGGHNAVLVLKRWQP
ncbi:beta-ketoacyl-ACP synthase II [Streptomyces buecherae]|uniref:beta-ketoacyl-ACP synthase II n=1 Tax=Streptomyces buecherae TaxID=2763006 RepID=UPI0033F1AE5B